MVTDPTYRPSTIHTGGNTLSVSYLRAWQTCRRYFYWQYVHRWDTGAVGIEPRYPMQRRTPLARYAQQFGSAFHLAVEHWRRSGWRDGKYDRDAALAAGRAAILARKHEFESDDDYAVVAAELEDLTIRYCAKWANEYPDVQVLALPDGRPAIEEYFEVPLADSGFTLNVRPDLLVMAHGFLAAQETKTASPQRAFTTIIELERSAQAIAELWVLRTFLGRDVAGIYADVAVKGNTKTVEKFTRRLVSIDEQVIDSFPTTVLHTLAEIGEVTAVPYLPLDQQLQQFPPTGMLTNACANCAMATLCWNPGLEDSTLAGFRPRTRRPDETITEEVTE